MKNPYRTLGVTKSSTQSEIKAAFNALALRYHPDRKSGSAEKFREVSDAYNRLKSSTERDTLDITAFEDSYRDSPEEVGEIKTLYEKLRGDVCKIIDSMVIGRDEDEERIRGYVEKWIAEGTVERYSKFAKRVCDNKKRLAARVVEAAAAEKFDACMESTGRSWGDFMSNLEQKYGQKALAKKRKR